MPSLISPDEAVAIVLSQVSPLPAEPVSLEEALGRVLGTDVTSVDPVPAFDNSAMDGFAVVASDTASAASDRPARLAIVAEARAGAPARQAVTPGTAARISTGAMIPTGADAVVRVEDTSEEGGAVAVRARPLPGQAIRRAGDDVQAGELVLRAGAPLGPAEVGVLASIGVPKVDCALVPGVALLTTGDELLAPGEPLRPGAVRNSNFYTLPALTRECRSRVVAAGTVADDRESIVRSIEAALDCDVLVISGGVSVGVHDHVKPALAELGVQERFWRVALRPGKPTWFGVREGRDRRTLVFGLPGNPVSAMITFLLFVRPALAALTGAPLAITRASAIMDDDYAKQPGRAHAVRCHMELRDDGWHVRPTKDQGSHVLTSMLGADALAIVEAERGDVRAGERVAIERLAVR